MGYFPIGDSMFNIYDSNSQFPGFFMLLQNFTFFSFAAGLGFNLFATATYYLMSPLNILIFFVNNINFHIFYTIIIYLKIGLAGLSMFIFLKSEEKNNQLWAFILSTAYALCGFMSTYYYMTIWMDHLYLLPILLLGIKKLVIENKSCLFIIMLSLSLMINYYIGYMLCIFSVIYFIYLNLSLKNVNYKKVIKKFIIASLISVAIATVILLPSFFALMQGKALWINNTDIEGFTNFFELNSNIRYFFYNLTPGSFQFNDYSYGPAQIYSSLLAVILVVLFFFNQKFSKKEKIAVAVIIGFFFLSFLWSGLDYTWQFFQRPIWWQSRYSFTLSAFLIIIAYKSIVNIKDLKLTLKNRILCTSILGALIIISFIFSYLDNHFYQTLSIIFICLSIFILVDYFFFVDKSYAKIIIVIILIVELFINSSSNLRKNDVTNSVNFETRMRSIRTNAINLIKDYDDSFYRMEFISSYGANDGMFFNYNGINYFNSVRNQKIVNFVEYYTDILVTSHCGIKLDNFNPFILSMFNIKYLITNDMDYFTRVSDNYSFSGFKNPHPLSIGFMVNAELKDVELITNQSYDNINKIFSSMINENIDPFNTVIGSFSIDHDYLILTENIQPIKINNEEINLKSTFTLIKAGDTIETDKPLKLLDIEIYERVMENLNQNILEVKESNHLLSGTVNVTGDKDILFLSIPFDEGLKVSVNGKRAEPILLLDTFIGISLEAGTHEITIDFIPKGFIPGSIISISGIALASIYLLKERKKRII